jgi:hypothetical protein
VCASTLHNKVTVLTSVFVTVPVYSKYWNRESLNEPCFPCIFASYCKVTFRSLCELILGSTL